MAATIDRFLVAPFGSGLLIFLLWPRPRIDEQSFKKIQNGMTMGQVEILLGGPSGTYFRGEPMDFHHQQVICSDVREWVGEEGFIIVVGFDETGRVVGKGRGYVTGYMFEQSWFEQLRWCMSGLRSIHSPCGWQSHPRRTRKAVACRERSEHKVLKGYCTNSTRCSAWESLDVHDGLRCSLTRGSLDPHHDTRRDAPNWLRTILLYPAGGDRVVLGYADAWAMGSDLSQPQILPSPTPG